MIATSARFTGRASDSAVSPTQTHSPSSFDPRAFLSICGEGSTTQQLRKNQLVFSQGDPADAVFYIWGGKVKVTVVSENGKESVVAILEAGDFFGEGCLISEPVRGSTARSIADSLLVRIEKQGMLRALRAEPAFAEFFLSYVLARKSRVEEDFIYQLSNSCEKRLARLLLSLSHLGKEAQMGVVIPQLSQEAMAEMIGTSRERVNFFINKFKRLGFIDYQRGELRVHRALLNVVLHKLRSDPGAPPVSHLYSRKKAGV